MCWPCEAVQSREAPADEVVRGYITESSTVTNQAEQMPGKGNAQPAEKNGLD